jgi:multidrug transporter EmrE-like cation transporter
MIFLLSAIFCSTAIALILKLGEERNYSRHVILSMNYIMATAISIWLVFRKELFKSFSEATISGFLHQLKTGYSGTDGFLSAQNTAIWSLLIGIPAGVLYYLSFLFYQRSVKASGVGMAGSYAKMGILVPMILSMVFWKEFPGGLQWAGMFLAIAAIAMVNFRFGEKKVYAAMKPALLLLFISCGMAEFSNKLFQRFGMLQMKDLFLFLVFATALLISILSVRGKPRKSEVLTGLVVGIPNFFASFFLINALSALPASVVFPSYSAGSIALICIGGRVFFNEKLTRKEVASILTTMTALLLINLQ